MKRKTSASYLFLAAASGCCAALVLIYAAGCGTPVRQLYERPETELVWPGPPEQARIRYVGLLSTEADLGKKVSWTEGLGRALFGEKRIGVLLGPYAVAIDEKDRLFVTDATGGLVHVFDLVTRDYRQISALEGDEQLLKPVGVTVVDDRIYVADSALHKICVFERDGDYVASFGAERLQRPSGVAYLPAAGAIYVADTARHAVDVFDRDGAYIKSFGSRGLGPGQFNFPTHLCTDNDGRVYVSDTLNYRIQVFTGDGKFLRYFGSQGDRPGNFAHPCGVATDTLGNIYVVDRQFENFQIFDDEGRILMAVGQEGQDMGEFWLPAGICTDRRNRIYVADSFNKRVQIFQLLKGLDQ
jgi:DNA-binding beta-propeller fold protein YncE